MATTIDTEMGAYAIYHVSEAGSPDAHDTSNGEWFFQPNDYSDGEVFSSGYQTAADAESAARDWADQEAESEARI